MTQHFSIRDRRKATVADVIDWYLANHQKRYKNRFTTHEVRRILSLLRDKLGKHLLAEMKPMDLLGFIEELARSCPHCGEARRRNERRCGGGFACTHCGENVPTIRSAWAKRRWLTTCRLPFNAACRLGFTAMNPTAGLSSPLGANGRDLTDREFRQVLRLASPVFRRVLLFLRVTGARPGELRKARWPDVSWLARCITLWDHKTIAKTGQARRIILNTIAMNLLTWLRRHSQAEYLFTNSHGLPWSMRALCRNFLRLKKAAGLPRGAKLYGCRHMFATRSIMNQVNPAVLAELLGHKHVSMTERYIHLAGKTDHLQAAAEQAVNTVKSQPAIGPDQAGQLLELLRKMTGEVA